VSINETIPQVIARLTAEVERLKAELEAKAEPMAALHRERERNIRVEAQMANRVAELEAELNGERRDLSELVNGLREDHATQVKATAALAAELNAERERHHATAGRVERLTWAIKLLPLRRRGLSIHAAPGATMTTILEALEAQNAAAAKPLTMEQFENNTAREWASGAYQYEIRATIEESARLAARVAELEAEVTHLRHECIATGDAAEMAVGVAKGIKAQRDETAAELVAAQHLADTYQDALNAEKLAHLATTQERDEAIAHVAKLTLDISGLKGTIHEQHDTILATQVERDEARALAAKLEDELGTAVRELTIRYSCVSEFIARAERAEALNVALVSPEDAAEIDAILAEVNP
jgi:hypothetical protein